MINVDKSNTGMYNRGMVLRRFMASYTFAPKLARALAASVQILSRPLLV
jgi:hypothetical protein